MGRGTATLLVHSSYKLILGGHTSILQGLMQQIHKLVQQQQCTKSHLISKNAIANYNDNLLIKIKVFFFVNTQDIHIRVNGLIYRVIELI